MSPIARFALAIAGSTALTPVVVLAAMPLLDPFWGNRPRVQFDYVAILAGVTLTALAVTALPLAIAVLSRRVGRAGLIALGNAAFGLILAAPLLLQKHYVSPAPFILGAAIAISSLIVSIVFFTTKERTSNG